MTDKKVVLSESEYKILERMVKNNIKEADLNELPNLINVDKSTISSIAQLLAQKGLVKIIEEKKTSYKLTEKGYRALSEGLPEQKLLHLLSRGINSIEEIRRELKDEVGIAIGICKRKGWIEVAKGSIRPLKDIASLLKEAELLRNGLDNVSKGKEVTEQVLKELLNRGLVAKEEVAKKIIYVTADEKLLRESIRVEKGSLTHQDLKSGVWRTVSLRKYDVTAEPPDVRVARRHFLGDFLEMLRDLMKELGFVEIEGPLVELELYNFDLLFQPQDHPAREVHDTLWIEDPSYGNLSGLDELVRRVAREHEKGWGYVWSPVKASRYVLRSQTTSVSARIISSNPRPPIRYFALGRVFRSDVVDASHLPEFHQLDGIMGDYDIGFNDLLGMLTEVSDRLGFKVKFKPGYFPFTEPSVEGYVKLPNGKWLELFGAGMFRPEVLKMAGIDYPVAAWGFGVERLAAAYYGITDIRHLYTRNVDYLSNFPASKVTR